MNKRECAFLGPETLDAFEQGWSHPVSVSSFKTKLFVADAGQRLRCGLD